MSHDSRDIFVRASHDSRETFARVSHDVRANFDQFYLSQLSLEMVLFMCIFVALCRSWKLPCDVFANVCEGLATGSRHMQSLGDGFAIIFVAQKSNTFLKLWRPVRNEFTMHARTLRYHANVLRQFATVWRIDSQTQ